MALVADALAVALAVALGAVEGAAEPVQVVGPVAALRLVVADQQVAAHPAVGLVVAVPVAAEPVAAVVAAAGAP